MSRAAAEKGASRSGFSPTSLAIPRFPRIMQLNPAQAQETGSSHYTKEARPLQPPVVHGRAPEPVAGKMAGTHLNR